MSVKKRTSPQEWIHDYFGPVLTVYASEDAESIASKNNLTFTELLQPFSKMGTDVTMKDVDGQNHNVPSLSLILQDFKKDPQKSVNTKLMLDRVSEENCDEKDMITKHLDKISLDAPGYTPWFDIWMKYYLQTLPTVEHEFLKHSLGCIFVVSTNSKDPVETFRALSTHQQRLQHDRASSNYPVYFNPSILKYYVLVHDSYSNVDDAAAQEMFTLVQNAFDSTNCHFLPLNSRKPDQSGESDNSWVAENWLGFSHRWCSIETRRGKSFTSGMSTSPVTMSVTENQTKPDSEENSTLPHPLAQPVLPDSPAHIPTAPKLTYASMKTVANFLSANDLDRIKIFIREFVIKSLIPYVEKQLRLTSEIVTNRKSRSLFSGAKRWFGANKPASGGGTSVVYSKEAPELQVRRMADLYFMMKLWKPAYNYYYIAKKDFLSDEAWPYYASAVECAALAMFMLSSVEPGKKYRPDYMEDSITKYLTLCQTPEFAVRATLFDGLCLKQQGMFSEAATSYIRMTNELSDLRSAMLLEQAAYCFLLASPASPRKYGFHIVLAGYRFTKTGNCKQHAARLYKQGSMVYSDSTWQLSNQHILYTLGHLKFMLKDFSGAAEYFNCLIENAVSGTAVNLQQMVHLREYFLVHHARSKEDKSVPVLTLPRLLSQETEIRMHEHLDTPDLSTWHSLEKVVKDTISGQDSVSLQSTCQPIFNNLSSNHLNPRTVVGETVFVKVRMENIFSTPLQIRKAYLLWRFTPDESEDSIANDRKEALTNEHVETGILDTTLLEKNSVTDLVFKLSFNTPGKCHILGVEYSIKAMFPDKEPTDHEIRGKQIFSIQPPHVNSVKDRKNQSGVGVDNRLEIVVMTKLPRLEASWNIPESLCEGEMRCCELELVNTGQVTMTNVHLVSMSPGLLSFGHSTNDDKEPRSLFEFPLIEDSCAEFRHVTPDGRTVQTSLDLMSVPLEGNRLGSGERAKIPIWIRGPSSDSESQSHRLVIYYDTSESPNKHTPRLLPVTLSIASQPSIQVTCERSGHLVHNNVPGKQLRIGISNVSKDLSPNMENINIVQVSLVSRDQTLSSVHSSDVATNIVRSHSSSIILDTAQIDSVPEKWRNVESLVSLPANVIIPGGNVHVSSVTSGSTSGFPVHQAPHMHFIKQYFQHNLGRRGNPPLLTSDLVLVLWKSRGPNPMHGQSVVRVQDVELVSEDLEKFDDAQLHIPAPEYPISAKVIMDSGSLDHDFLKNRLCRVGGSLILSSLVDSQVQLEYSLKEQVKGARLTGNTDGTVILESGIERKLNFSVLVTRPGLYHLNNFQFKAKTPCDMKNEPQLQFIPLDMSFCVNSISVCL